MKGTSQEYRNTFQVKKRGNRLIKNRRHGPPFIEINSHWVVRYFLIIYFTVRNYLSLNIPGHFILVSLWKINKKVIYQNRGPNFSSKMGLVNREQNGKN